MTRLRVALAAMLLALFSGLAMFVAPAAHAVTYSGDWKFYYGGASTAKVSKDTTDVWCKDTSGIDRFKGQVTTQTRFQYQKSTDGSTWRWRLDKNYDINIVNDSDAWLRIDPPNLSWYRLTQTNQGIVSYYVPPTNSGGANSLLIGPRNTAVLSVDNPIRWNRNDGVSDSDPSPYNTPIAHSSQPIIDIYYNVVRSDGNTYCGGAVGEILNPVLEGSV